MLSIRRFCKDHKEELEAETISLQEIIENSSNEKKRLHFVVKEIKQDIEKERDYAINLVKQVKD